MQLETQDLHPNCQALPTYAAESGSRLGGGQGLDNGLIRIFGRWSSYLCCSETQHPGIGAIR